MLYSQHYGSLIHCFADGRNKRKIKLPPLESLQSRINSREFTSSSGTAAAAFSVEDACWRFHGLKVNVRVKGGERRKARRVGEVGEILNRNSRLKRRMSEAGATWGVYTCAAGCCCIDCLLRLFFHFTQRFLHICGDSSVLSLDLQIIWLNIKSLQGKIRKWTNHLKSQRWIEIKTLNPAVGYRKQDLSLRSEIHTEQYWLSSVWLSCLSGPRQTPILSS